MHFLENSLLSRHFTCIIHNCQIFQNSKATVQIQLRIQCSCCSFFSCWISLWVYLWLSANVFRHCCTEKGLFGCKIQAVAQVFTQSLEQVIFSQQVCSPYKKCSSSPCYRGLSSCSLSLWLGLWSEFRVLLPWSIFFFNAQSSILIIM